MLGGHGMLVSGADIEDITWHGEVARVFGVNWAVVPFKCHAGKAGVVNFLRYFIVLFESLAKMIQVGIPSVLNGKFVDNECKHDRAPFVTPEPGCGGCLILVKFGKGVLEEFVGKCLLGGDRTCHGASQSRSRSWG